MNWDGISYENSPDEIDWRTLTVVIEVTIDESIDPDEIAQELAGYQMIFDRNLLNSKYSIKQTKLIKYSYNNSTTEF